MGKIAAKGQKVQVNQTAANKLKGSKPRTSSGSAKPFRVKSGGTEHASVEAAILADPTSVKKIYAAGARDLAKLNRGMTVAQAGARIAIMGRYVRAAG